MVKDKRFEHLEINENEFYAFIEITKGSKNKYEYDDRSGLLMLDRVLYTSTHYPHNYGFIPKTYADDGDALDVLVLCSERIDPYTLVKCKPIATLKMIDQGKYDYKVIAVPFGDATFSQYNSVEDLPRHIFDEIKHFFTVYKTLENKETDIRNLLGLEETKKIILHDLAAYKNIEN